MVYNIVHLEFVSFQSIHSIKKAKFLFRTLVKKRMHTFNKINLGKNVTISNS